MSVRTPVIIVMLFLGVSLAAAQGNTFVSIGVGVPQGPTDFSRNWDPGLSLGGGIEAPIGGMFALTLAFDLTTFPLNQAKFLESQGEAGTGVSISGGASSILTLTLGGKVKVLEAPKLFAAYVIGQAGYLNFSKKDLEVYEGGYGATLPGEESSAFCVGGGAGVEAPLGKISEIYLEGRYVAGLGGGKPSYLPVRLGIKIQL